MDAAGPGPTACRTHNPHTMEQFGLWFGCCLATCVTDAVTAQISKDTQSLSVKLVSVPVVGTGGS